MCTHSTFEGLRVDDRCGHGCPGRVKTRRWTRRVRTIVRGLWLCVTAMPMIVLSGLSRADQPCEVMELPAAELGTFADFGNAVAIDGDLAVVGARLNDGPGCSGDSLCARGSVFVFRKEGAFWVQELYGFLICLYLKE